MSNHELVERKKKKKDNENLRVQKISRELVPKELKAMVRKGEKQVAIAQSVNHPTLWSMLSTPFSVFESPLVTKGFQSAGENAVGLVIQPRARGAIDNLVRALTNSSTILNAWGHTALYVRIDGKIARVIGFDPFKISRDVILSGNRITTGAMSTPGHYNDDSGLFQNNSARSVEYIVDRDLAVKVLNAMPHHGPAAKYPGQMQRYVGSPGKHIKGAKNRSELEVGNCISFAMNTIRKQLGADIYAFGSEDSDEATAVIDLGGELNAMQGPLSRQFVYLDKGSKKTLVLRFGGSKEERQPVVGAMPKSFVVIKGLTHAYLLTSVARFTAPYIASMLPTPLYSMVPAAPWLLQSGLMAKHDTGNALMSAFTTLSDQYISPETMSYLQKIGLLIGTVYILYGGEDLEIVYGLWSYVFPYIMEWLAEGTNRLTGY